MRRAADKMCQYYGTHRAEFSHGISKSTEENRKASHFPLHPRSSLFFPSEHGVSCSCIFWIVNLIGGGAVGLVTQDIENPTGPRPLFWES